MQATLDAFSLKALTRALTCLSKYGEELSIYATPDFLSFSATNSSKSAYCRFKYDKHFFSRFRVGAAQAVGDWADDIQEVQTVTGQFMTKSLLSILKHRTVEKSVERCEISIVEGKQTMDEEEGEEEQDGLESKLILRLHCKHGVIKTHRLVLLTPVSLMAPGMPDSSNESRLTIGPKALKDLIDHFPISKGAKSDPQLVWTFDDTEVGLKTLESSIDSRGRGQLSTELTISADEFEGYDMFTTPTTIAFHLREFNATIAFADSMSLPLDLRFTDPAAPLFIDIEGDSTETLFVISTSQVLGAPTATQSDTGAINNRKREREGTSSETPRIKKPMKAAQPAARASSATSSRSISRVPGSMPPPSVIPRASFSQVSASQAFQTNTRMPSALHQPIQPRVGTMKAEDPLFLPSSQMSVADEEALRALAIDSLDANELAGLLEDEGEEVDFSYMSQVPVGRDGADADVRMEDPDSFELIDEGELVATQSNADLSKVRPRF